MNLGNKGCLTFLFGFGGASAGGNTTGTVEPSASEEGNYHSGPGGYEGMGYSGGYAADYRAEADYFDDGHEGEA